MIKIENVGVYGFEAAIRGMRNPKNSWDKSDTVYGEYYGRDENGDEVLLPYKKPMIGNNDLKLMKALAGAGTDHGKFMRMITVTLDITAPLYWWKEFDTYKVGTVANSCSTMHKIHAKEFTFDDFSHEHIELNFYRVCLEQVIYCLNVAREDFLKTKNKTFWWQMIQLLPSSYNQKRTVQLNYTVLKNMYHARRNHKLDEWHTFCEWVETLPYAELIIG